MALIFHELGMGQWFHLVNADATHLADCAPDLSGQRVESSWNPASTRSRNPAISLRSSLISSACD